MPELTRFLGCQIIREGFGIANQFDADDVLPFTFSLRWIREHGTEYTLKPIFEGDIKNPKFPHGKSSLQIEV